MRSGGSSGVPYGRLDWDTSQQIPRIRRSSELAAEVEDHLVSARPPRSSAAARGRLELAHRRGPKRPTELPIDHSVGIGDELRHVTLTACRRCRIAGPPGQPFGRAGFSPVAGDGPILIPDEPRQTCSRAGGARLPSSRVLVRHS